MQYRSSDLVDVLWRTTFLLHYFCYSRTNWAVQKGARQFLTGTRQCFTFLCTDNCAYLNKQKAECNKNEGSSSKAKVS